MNESAHFLAMLRERDIRREWVDRTVREPDRTKEPGDGTKHYMKRILENEGRWLRVVVNITVTPQRYVTTFFDRRLGSEK
jgi:hypothetical protein